MSRLDELAVAQHLEDLLTSDRGNELLEGLGYFLVFGTRELRDDDEQGCVRAVRELAAWLASELVGRAYKGPPSRCT